MPSRATVTKARGLRRTMTPPEVKLWQYLRTQPDGVKFRRQHPIGLFVLDFYCPSASLAIEVDGMAHGMGDNPERDERRDAWLRDQDIVVLRVAAIDVMRDFEAVVRLILEACAFPLHHPAGGPPPHALHGEE